MPFMHSEDLEHQRRFVELLRGLGDAAASDSAEYTVRHMERIDRFGRPSP